MKIINFLENVYNSSVTFKQFLKNLNPESYKRDKTSIVKYIPSRKNSEEFIKLQQEVDFKDTTYVIIPSQKNLIIFDLDNTYTSEIFIKKLQSLNINTLVTQSPYGAHIYFYYNKELESQVKQLMSIIPKNIVSSDKVEEALNNKSIKAEVFSPFYNSKKLVFDGANNSYYKVTSLVTKPCLITQEFLNFYTSLADGAANNSRLLSSPQGHFNILNKNKADFLYDCLEVQDIDFYEFQLYYCDNEFSKKMTIEEAKSNRNNYLNSVWASFASCGYIKEEEDLKQFIYLVAEKLLDIQRGVKEKGSNYSDFYEELDNTVCRAGRFKENNYMLEKETVKAERYVEKKGETSISPFSTPIFIGINMGSDSGTSKFVLINFKNLKKPRIIKLHSVKFIENYMRAYPELISLHKRQFIDSKGNVEYSFNEDTCPLIFIDRIRNDYENLILAEESFFIINLNYFSFNKNITKVLEEDKELLLSGELTKEQIIKDFKQTRWAKIVERNHLYDKNVRNFFYSNIKDYLITKSYRSTMLIIKDLKGNTGKDSIITPYLEQMFFGEGVSFGNAENSYVTSSVENSRSVSASTISKEHFTDYLTSKLIVINEDGDEINNKQLNCKLQSFLKNSVVTVREMYKGSRTVEVGTFFIRYTNSSNKVINQSEANTRYYVAHARQDVTKEEWDEIFKDYTHLSTSSAGKVFAKEDEIAMLRYFLLLEHDVNPHTLPKNLPEEPSETPDDIEVITDIKKSTQFRSDEEYVETIFNFVFNSSSGSIKTEELDRLRQIYPGSPPKNLKKEDLPYIIMLIANTLRAKKYKLDCVVEELQIKESVKLVGNSTVSDIFRNKLTIGLLANLLKGWGYYLSKKQRNWIVQKLTNGEGSSSSTKLTYLGE